MPGPGRRRTAALVAAALVVAGCASGAPRAPGAGRPLGTDEAVELVRRWEAAWQAFPGLRAAVDLTVVRRGRSDRTAALLLLAPTRLRLEVATPFGFPALVATAGPERIVIFRPLEGKASIAGATPEALARWLGAPLPLDVLIALLVGHVPLPADPGAVRVESGEGGPSLVYARGGVGHRVWLTPERRPARLLLDGGERATVTFTWAVGEHLQGLKIEVPGRQAELSLRYLSAEYVFPPPEAFELLLPVNAQVEHLD